MPVGPRSGELEAELLDERGVACRPGDGRRPRVRHVGEESAQGDDELDAEVLDEVDDEVAERAPANVRLDAGSSTRRGPSRELRVEERVVGPLDRPGHALDSETVGRVAWKS